MKRHLFLTGEKQVGKSTLLKLLLSEIDLKLGGFFTIKSNAVFKDGIAVHILNAGTGEVPTRENALFWVGSSEGEISKADMAERFDRLGCAALETAKEAELVMMDELGPHEAEAVKFRETVLRVLDGDVPVFGVLQKADCDFLDQIAARPDVEVIVVTEQNRDSLREEKILNTFLNHALSAKS